MESMKRWIDNVKEDLHQSESDLPQVLKCIKGRRDGGSLSMQPHRRQPTGEDGQVKEELHYFGQSV